MERSFVVRALAILGLALHGGLVHGAVADDSSGLHLTQSVIALGSAPDGSAIEEKTFYKNEEVYFFTTVSFDPAHGGGGNHHLVYKWYTGESVSLSFGAKKRFDANPTTWWAFTHVAHFPPGHHRAELYIDDQLFATGEFDTQVRERPTEPEEEVAIKDASIALLLAGDTRHFDQLAKGYRESSERTASGTWKLSMLYNAVEAGLFAPEDPRWKQLEDLSADWLTRQPESATAVALNARILYSHAWSWRGTTAATQVPPYNWQLYQKLLQQARSTLEQHANVAQQDPEWDTLNISIARQQGASTEETLAMAERALQRWPCFYALHNATVNALLPRFGGSRQAIQTYIKLALEHSRAQEGNQVYARIYYYISRTAHGDPLDELNLMDAKWPLLQQSLTEILNRYRSSFNQDVARDMACLAGDAVGYRLYGGAATGHIISIAPWDRRAWRQNCNEWAFEGKHAGTFLDHAGSYVSFFRGFGPEIWGQL
jgi:hypothetical protein